MLNRIVYIESSLGYGDGNEQYRKQSTTGMKTTHKSLSDTGRGKWIKRDVRPP